MKPLFAILLVGLLLAPSALAQKRVSDGQLHGTWKLVITIDASESESALGRIALKAVGGLLDEIDVRMAFEENNRLNVMVNAFGDDQEQEESTWEIDRNGLLHLGDTDSFDSEDTVWMWQDSRLRAFDRGDGKTPGEAKPMYLERLEG